MPTWSSDLVLTSENQREPSASEMSACENSELMNMEAIFLAVFFLLFVIELLSTLPKLLYKEPRVAIQSLVPFNRNKGGCFAKLCKNRGKHKSYFAAIERPLKCRKMTIK